MKISFEIVPRSQQALDDQYRFVQQLGTSISMINVPDIQRFEIRSWETSRSIKRDDHQFVPHFRATDFSLKSGDIFKIIDEYELDHVLLVSGDPPEGIKRKHYHTSVLDLIKAVRSAYPDMQIYAGFDPHRNGLQAECDYIAKKHEAGANGFFSQPFYDLRMIEIYAEQMRDPEIEVFMGISPITTESSKHYWEVKNKVRFPAHFDIGYSWNIDFAKQALSLAEQQGFNIYFMPIRIDLEQYFAELDLERYAPK